MELRNQSLHKAITVKTWSQISLVWFLEQTGVHKAISLGSSLHLFWVQLPYTKDGNILLGSVKGKMICAQDKRSFL